MCVAIDPPGHMRLNSWFVRSSMIIIESTEPALEMDDTDVDQNNELKLIFIGKCVSTFHTNRVNGNPSIPWILGRLIH